MEAVSTPQESAPISSFAELMGLDDVEWKEVHVPQWKRSVWLRSPTAADRDAHDQVADAIGPDGKPRVPENVRADLVARCWYDRATNTRVAQTPEQVAKLGTKNAAAIAFLYGECKALAGMLTKAQVDLLKNSSVGVPDSASGSGSPTNGTAPSASSTPAA